MKINEENEEKFLEVLPEQFIIELGLCNCCGRKFGIVIAGRVVQYRCFEKRIRRQCDYNKIEDCNYDEEDCNLSTDEMKQIRMSNCLLLHHIMILLLHYNDYIILLGNSKEVGITLRMFERLFCWHEFTIIHVDVKKYLFGLFESIYEKKYYVLIVHKKEKACEESIEVGKKLKLKEDYPFIIEVIT